MLVSERILFRVILLFVASRRSSVKRLADYSMLGTCIGNLTLAVTIPLQVAMQIVTVVSRNILIYIAIVLLCSCLYILNTNSSTFIVAYTGTYNSGIGQLINIYLEIVELPALVCRGLIPIYNWAVYLLTQFLYWVLLPFSRVNSDNFPEFIENVSMMFTAFVLSIRTFLVNVFSCVMNRSADKDSSLMFLPTNVQCYANIHHYEFDMMTPGIFARKSALLMQNMLVKTCSPVSIMIELMMFPLLDINFYKTLHLTVNSMLHAFVVLPIMTVKRCEYGRSNEVPFSNVEKTVMCIPDFTAQHTIMMKMFESLGLLVDNWLNVGLTIVEEAVTGRTTVQCDAVYEKRFNMTRAGDLFDVSPSKLKVVGMTDRLFAVTDGVSTEYHSTTVTEQTEMAVGNWPFEVNVGYGVAAVQQAEISDMDDNGDSRTGMLGCQCLDETRSDGSTTIQVWCASVPYTVHEDNETNYNASTVHRVNFDSYLAGTGLTCATTKIKVSTLRFSQKRFSKIYNSVEGNYLDAYNTFFDGGTQRARTFLADATIYLQPLCGSDSSQQCIAGGPSCFPYCMGLHVAGQTGQNITLYNAEHWSTHVDMKQVDCSISLATDVCSDNDVQGFVVNEEHNIHHQAVCNQGCAFDYNSETFMKLSALSDGDKETSFLKNEDKHPTIRMKSQPIVVAGDILLTKSETNELIMNRLFDVSKGFYTMEGQHLTLVSNDQTISMLTDDTCEVLDDEMCYSSAAKENKIVEPVNYRLASYEETPSTVSEFGVHWAVNPQSSVLSTKYQNCANNIPTSGIEITSSYSKARVWTLRPVRASSADTTRSESGEHTGLVSYMVVPNWMNEDTPCSEMVNQRVVDLEYINSENILITVYRAAPEHYNWETGSVCDGCPFDYAMYYLHPNRGDCVEAQESGHHFSCWKSISLGIFQSPDYINDGVGSLCPSMHRMPEWGTMSSLMGIASVSVLKLVVDAVTVLPAAWYDMASVFKQPRERITFHSVLDTGGELLLNVEPIVSSLDRASMIAAHSLPKLGSMLRDTNGYASLQPVLIGTAKIHSFVPGMVVRQNAEKLANTFVRGTNQIAKPFLSRLQRIMSAVPTERITSAASSVVSRINTGLAQPLARQFKRAVQQLPTGHMLRFSSAVMGRYTSMGGLMPPSAPYIQILVSLRRFMNSATSQLTMNSRVLRGLFLNLVLRNNGGDSMSNLISSTFYELEHDVDRSYLESMRIQCDGLGQIVGRDVWGDTLKHTCLIIPATLKSTLQALMVFLVEYRVMSCVCSMSQETNSILFAKSQCLPKNTPIMWKSFTLDFLQQDTTSQRDLCFAFMDAANEKLITAFDPVFNHMYRATLNIGASIDYVLRVFNVNAGNCADYQASPYILTLLPEPNDYFMGCMGTYDCRARCLDTFTAFEDSMKMVNVRPTQEISHTVMVESRFFSIEDAENGLDVAPFALYGMAELSAAACEKVCGNSNEYNRCVAVAGILSSNRIGLAYYCMPFNFMDSIFEYTGENAKFNSALPFYNDNWGVGELVSNIYMLTIDSVQENRHEMLLVSTQERENADIQKIWVFTSDGDKFLLCQTEEFDADVDSSTSLHSINSIRAIPGQRLREKDKATVFIKGTRFERSSDGETIELVNVCVKYGIMINDFIGNLNLEGVDDAVAFNARVSQERNVCEDYVNFENEYDNDHKIICMNEQCSDQLRIPLVGHAKANVIRRDTIRKTSVAYTYSNPQSNLAKILSLDPAYALIETQEEIALNRKFIADLTLRSSLCQEGRQCLNFIVVGRLTSASAWLHNVYLTLNEDGSVSSNLTGGVNIAQKVKRSITCSVDSCFACANRESPAELIDLQNKCYAASQCAVRRCVGTMVNMKAPLCNLGNRMAKMTDTLRIGMHATWLAISHTVVVVVELTEERRNIYRITWPQEFFMAAVCNMKDSIVEQVATLTSVSGAVLASMHVNDIPSPSYDANDAAIDVRVHGKQIMFITSMTNLLSNIMMYPIYIAVASQKVTACRMDSFLVMVNRAIDAAGTEIQILRGTPERNEASDNLVGMCMSKYGDVASLDADNGQEKISSLVGQFMTDIRTFRRSYYFEPYIHAIDAGFAYAQGVVTGIMDVTQVVDWAHCKLPETSMQLRGRCVCSDEPMRIPSPQRSTAIHQGSHALWCSGPLLLTNVDGSDLLIWNPFSLDQLLNPGHPNQGGSGDFVQYLQCLQSLNGDCNALKPRIPKIEAQGAEVMQVVTRCRANYQQSTWDDGAVYLGELDYDTWQQGLATVGAFLQTSKNPGVVKRLMQIWQHVEVLGGEIADRATIECLQQVYKEDIGSESCMREYFLYSSQSDKIGIKRKNAYFVYEANDPLIPHTFVETDSCQTFSGSVGSINPSTGLSFPKTLWSVSSSNRVDVSMLHEMATGNNESRLLRAEANLRQLLDITILPELNRFGNTLSDKIETRSWSFEGDQLHQLIDCVVLGPYASADMQSTFELSNGRRLAVEQYHRGDPQSRDFNPGPGYATGGSDARQHIIGTAQKLAQDSLNSGLQETFTSILHDIKRTYSDISNFYCTCPGTQDSSLECCKGKSFDDLKFNALRKFPDIWNINEDMQVIQLQSVIDDDILRKDIWSKQEYSYVSTVNFTESEIEELHDKYVFDDSNPVMEYSKNEVMTQFTGKPLRTRCMELLSMSFFTMPIKSGVSDMQVDTDTHYDPTVNNTAYLHGMEEAINRILQRSQQESPVYWTHVHRYMPSDSVWCENILSDPTPASANVLDVGYNVDEYAEVPRYLDRIRGHALDDTKFVRDISSRCVCDWTLMVGSELKCKVPDGCENVHAPADLQVSWQTLCEKGHYDSRAELFTLLRVIQESDDILPAWAESCADAVPSVTWGLLDSKQNKDWFQNSDVTYNINLQELASYGPSGLRMGLLGRETDANLKWMQKHNFLRRDPANLPFNAAKMHTIAQPYCSKDNDATLWKADLKEYFRDVFFPMAHTIHTSGVSSYCSTWVIEYAISVAMRHIYEDLEHEEVILQDNKQAKWRQRCEINLQQIGICNLRGVYDIVPDDPDEFLSSCDFNLAADHGCTSYYVTHNCLLMCDSKFYDPCACGETDCTNVLFKKDNCDDLELDPRQFADGEDVKLYSMQWPTSIHEKERGSFLQSDIDDTLAQIHQELGRAKFEHTALFERIKTILVQHDEDKTEGDPPDAFCDDLVDYFGDDAQHPVGYHATTVCSSDEAHMRGFDSWMSTGVSGADWTVDPVRLRNMTLYSTTYGASHLICDASVYGAYGHELNPFYISTRWNENQKVDPAVPVTNPRDDNIENMRFRGTPSKSGMDTSIVSEDRILRHSVGLIRNWLRSYGDDPDLQEALDSAWPHYNDETPEFYGLSEDDIEGCPMPPLRTCFSNAECDSVDLVCLQPPKNDEDDEQAGICAHKDTCYQHSHCSSGLMCSGQGKCVQPYIIFNNRNGERVNVQLFASESEECDDTMYGISEGQGVPSFAHDNGLCSLRNWYMYENMTEGAEPEGALRLMDGDTKFQWPEDPESKTAGEHNVLHTAVHACDRSYQHALHFCSPSKVRAANLNDDSTESDVAPNRMKGIRTREKIKGSDRDKFRFCDMPRSSEISGFVSPYVYADDTGIKDTLRYVHQTVARCDEFQVCSTLKFTVDQITVQRKVLRGDNFEGNFHRTYWNNDADICYGAGYRMDTACSLADECQCVVDRYTSPLVNGLFATDRNVPVNTFVTPLDSTWDDQALDAMFQSVRSKCVHAFSNEIDQLTDFPLFKRYFEMLTREYSSQKKEVVTQYANTLLPSLFGIDVVSGQGRGIYDIDDYVNKSRCVRHISDMLEKAGNIVTGTVSDRKLRPYPVSSADEQEAVPGKSLYMFHERAAISIEFDWFWKCVVLASSDRDGGVQSNWFDLITKPGQQQELRCENLEKESGLTLREHLQTSDTILELPVDVSDRNNDLVDEINKVVGRALDELQITMLPNVFCAWCNESCPFDGNKLNLYRKDTCWVKSGFDPTSLATTMELTQAGEPKKVKSMYRYVYEQTLGSTDPEFESINSLEEKQFLLERTLDADHNTDKNFIPIYYFVKLKQAIKDYEDLAGFYEDPGIIITQTTCSDIMAGLTDYIDMSPSDDCPKFYGRLKNYEFEFVGAVTKTISNLERKYLTLDQAKFEIFKIVQREIYNTNDLKNLCLGNNGLSDRIMPLATTNLAEFNQKISQNIDWNVWMSEKNFACQDGGDLSLGETNQLHQKLRECVEDLSIDIGWEVDHRLRLNVSSTVLLNDFYPSFSEPITETFLEALTSKSISENADMRYRMCYKDQRNNGYTVMNPLWTGDYDVTSCPFGLACGCDTRLEHNWEGDNTRVVDTRCGNTLNCESHFPRFYKMLYEDTPEHCQTLGQTLQAVGMRREGSLRDSETPLCRKTISFSADDECNGRFGSLHGHQGATVRDLYLANAFDGNRQIGLFDISNSIFRRRNTDRFTLSLNAMRVKASDIGGHGLEFGIGSDGNLHLDCVHLREDHAACAKDSSNEFLPGTHDWLSRIEDSWGWRQRAYETAWSPDVTAGASVSWKCPLKWWTAFSSSEKPFSVRTPFVQRNRLRFQHITGANYSNVHPVVSSIVRLPNLQPARFVADNRACKDNTCHGMLSDVLHEMYDMAHLMDSKKWKHVDLEGSSMSDAIIDWPHSYYHLYDDSQKVLGTDMSTSVLERLPHFAMRYEEHTEPVSVPTSSVSVAPAGVCHMHRLPRFTHAEESDWPADKYLQLCTKEQEGVRCKWTQGSNSGFHMFTYSVDHATPRKERERHKRCRHCHTYTGKFQDRNLVTHDLSSEYSMLSVGIPMRISTERMVANYLRSKLCPVASTECTRLDEVFNSQYWVSGQFLRNLLEADETSDFYDTWIPNPSDEGSNSNTISDQNLWARNWVYCDQQDTTTACTESIDKTTWIDPQQRSTSCLSKVLASAPSTEPVEFCLLDSNTQAICTAVVEWNSEIKKILCEAMALPECPVSSFFYTPASYSVENQQFVSNTVFEFYESLAPATCDPYQQDVDDESIQLQIESNENEKGKCASTLLVPVRQAIASLRGAVGFAFRIFYFYMMLWSQVGQIILGSVIGTEGVSLVQDAVTRMLRYLGLLMESVANFFHLLLEAVWQLLVEQTGSFGEFLKGLMKAICILMNFVRNEILCPIMKKILAPILNEIGNVVKAFNGGAGKSIKKMSVELKSLADDHLCNEMDCTFEFLSESKERTGTLPVPTRCWSSYITFFGDSDTLSCTRADTCRESPTSNKRVTCAQCSSMSDSFHDFSCDPMTKLCTCNVQRYVRTPCSKNDHCQESDATCSYLLSDMSVSVGSTPCRTCQTDRVCYLDVKTDERFCACGLFPLQFSSCDSASKGQTVMPSYNKLCLFNPDSRFLQTSTYAVRFSDVLTVPCMEVDDLSSLYCMKVVDRSDYMLVSKTASLVGRRLLAASGEESVAYNMTRNGVCRDAMKSEWLPDARAACEKAIYASRRVVRKLGLSNWTSECIFCSFDDFWYEMTTNPAFVSHVASQPILAIKIISELVPQNWVTSALSRVTVWSEVIAHSYLSGHTFDNNTVSNVESIVSAVYNSSQQSSGSRKLLGLQNMVHNIEQIFEQTNNIHTEYASQISSFYDFNYAGGSIAGNEWRYQWPPSFDLPSDDQCQPLQDMLELMKDTIETTYLSYSSPHLQGTPSVLLRDAWPKLVNYSNGTNVSQPLSALPDGFLERGFVLILRETLNFFGIGDEYIYNLYKSILAELESMVRCDFYAVQTCSRWRVKLLHGIIILSVYFSVWILFWNSMRLSLVLTLTTPLFVILLLYMCYGYSPFCLPQIPICMIEDIISTVRYFFPKYLILPQAMIREDVQDCQPNDLFPNATCLKDCSSSPFEYVSWEPVFAWGVVEFGGVIQKFVEDNIEYIPGIDHSSINTMLDRKQVIIEHADDDMIAAQRLCFIVNFYRAVPYLAVVVLVIMSVFSFGNLLYLILTPLVQIISQLFVSIFTE